MNKSDCIPRDSENERKCISNTDSEKCWKATYKNASRKWLIQDASPKMSPDNLYSTMKDSYRYIEQTDTLSKTIGQKKELLLKKFEQEAIKEVMEECQVPPTLEEYCTEYDRNFSMTNYEPDEDFFKRNGDLYIKYPLYSSIPTSYYSYKLIRENQKEMLHGFTKVSNNIHPFKRSSEFSKPINEVFDASSR